MTAVMGPLTSIVQAPPVISKTVQRHQVNVNPQISNLFALKAEELKEILGAVNNKFAEIEKKRTKSSRL